jgi:hypothetical protein
LHVSPSSRRGWHLPALQYETASQSPSTEQSPLQALPAHAYGEQLTGSSRTHDPVPSQNDASTPSFVTPSHAAGEHSVARGGYAHSLVVVPSHAPPHTLPSLSHASLS